MHPTTRHLAVRSPRPPGRLGGWGPGRLAHGMQIPDKMSFSVFHGHGCRWEDPSDLSSTRPTIRHEDVFPRPSDHFKARGGHAGPPTTRPSRLSGHQARGWERGGGADPRPLVCHFRHFARKSFSRTWLSMERAERFEPNAHTNTQRGRVPAPEWPF